MMRLLLIIALIAISVPAVAFDNRLVPHAPAKPADLVVAPSPSPDALRQGGDTVDDATVIDALPYDDVGTTAGYNDDYNYPCPYDTPGSPDVVYTITLSDDTLIDIDLCGSSYDTKLYFCDAELNLIDCSDDYYFDGECGWYVSALFGVPVDAGLQYFIIIDGYWGDFGDYVLAVTGHEPCDIVCPPEGFPEGEPDLVDGYVDGFNSGCGAVDGPPWPLQNLNVGPPVLDFCGVAGWFIYQDAYWRDEDWLTAAVGESGLLEITANAESMTNVFQLWIEGDCEDMAVVQILTVNACSPGTLTIVGDPGAVANIWVGSANFTNPGDVPSNMYDYVLTIDGLAGSATEIKTWSQVKGLYR